MPAKNTIKNYVPQGFYHLYNRGVEKREIFIDKQDYQVFLYYLKLYLSPKEAIIEEIKKRADISFEKKAEKIMKIIHLNNFHQKIDLLCFTQMPNHFHLQIRQKNKQDMESFMRSLITKYVIYFNKKYQRVGYLFQGRYKAVNIEKEEYLLQLSRYIHLNAKEMLKKNQKLSSYPWSSYPAYINNLKITWLNKNYILSFFKKIQGFSFTSYQRFVEGYKWPSDTSDKEKELCQKLLLD